MSDAQDHTDGEPDPIEEFAENDYAEVEAYQRAVLDGPPPPRSSTDIIAQSAELHGAAPQPGETDSRPVWDAPETLAHLPVLFTAIAEICPPGTMLADDQKHLAYGLVHSFHRQHTRLTKLANSHRKDLTRAGGAVDGNDDTVDQLDAALDAYRTASDRAKAFEHIFSASKTIYTDIYKEAWAPTHSNFAAEDDENTARIVTPAQVRKATAYIRTQQQRPSTLAEQATRYNVSDRLLSSPGAPDPTELFNKWRSDWAALHAEATKAGIHPSEHHNYPIMRRRAEELEERPDLPAGADLAIAGFLQKPLPGATAPHAAPSAEPATTVAAPHATQPEPVVPSAWNAERAMTALRTLATIIDQDVLADGTQLHDERESVLWSVANSFYRHADRLQGELTELTSQPDYDPAQVTPVEQRLRDRIDAFESLRDYMISTYAQLTLKEWRPANTAPPTLSPTIPGKPVDPTRTRHTLRDSIIQPEQAPGAFVAFSGDKKFNDFNAIYNALDAAKREHPDMTLIHRGQESELLTIVQSWARNNDVDQVIIKPEWPEREPGTPKLEGDEYRALQRKVLNECNDNILAQKPAVLLSFDAPGYPEDIARRATKLKIPVRIFHHPDLPPKTQAARPEPEPPAPPVPAWDQPPPAVRQYQSFIADWQGHHASAKAAGVEPLHAPGADLLTQRAHSLASSSYLPAPAAANIKSFLENVKAFEDAKTEVEITARGLERQAKRSFTQQVYAPPIPGSDEPLRHRAETKGYAAWAKATDELLAAHEKYTADPDTYAPHLTQDESLAKQLERNVATLGKIRADDTFQLYGESLFNDLRRRSLAVARASHTDRIMWIDHPDTRDLLRHADLLEKRPDISPQMVAQIDQFRTQYTAAVEARTTLTNTANEIDAHLETREAIRREAAKENLYTTEHPGYAAWSDTVDRIQRDASRLLGDTTSFSSSQAKLYADHLRADPALKYRLKSSTLILVSTRDDDLKLAAVLPPNPALAPQPTVQHKIEPAPEPEPIKPPDPKPRPEPDINLSPGF